MWKGVKELYDFYKFQYNQDSGPAWKPAKADVAPSPSIVIIFDS